MPPVPATLAVTSFSPTAVSLSWAAVAGADSYRVHRAEASAVGSWGHFQLINVATVTGTTYTDNAANSLPVPKAGSTYLYMVTAMEGSDESIGTPVVSASFVEPVLRVPGDFEEDIKRILDYDPMCKTATYTRFGFAPVFIIGWFDNPTKNNKDKSGNEVENSGPQFTCATADVEYAGHRDTLVLAGITYYVAGVDPDGSGMTVLRLSKDAPC